METTRARRTYSHKGKVRFKRRLPRKLKKRKQKQTLRNIESIKDYMNRLVRLHGDKWMNWFIIGG